jgi:hypothetical protein
MFTMIGAPLATVASGTDRKKEKKNHVQKSS